MKPRLASTTPSRARVDRGRSGGANKAAGGVRLRAPPAGAPDDLGTSAAVSRTYRFIRAMDDLGVVHALDARSGNGMGGATQLHRGDGDAKLVDRLRQPVVVR